MAIFGHVSHCEYALIFENTKSFQKLEKHLEKKKKNQLVFTIICIVILWSTWLDYHLLGTLRKRKSDLSLAHLGKKIIKFPNDEINMFKKTKIINKMVFMKFLGAGHN